MNRYKLKMDIPAYKRDEEFHLSKKGNLVHTKSGKLTYPKKMLKEYPSVLKDWFEEIPDEPKTVWDLEEGDDAWFISGGGVKSYISMDRIELTFFKDMVEVGDGFVTKKDAEKELAWRKARQTLLRDTKGFKPDWSGDSWNVEVYYDYVADSLSTEYYCNTSNHKDLWFETKKDAEESIAKHEEEWRVYLGVEE